MKKIVSVPRTLPPTSCTNVPKALQYLGSFMRYWYSSNHHVSASNTAYVCAVWSNVLLEICGGPTCNYLSITGRTCSCANKLVALEHVLMAGPLCHWFCLCDSVLYASPGDSTISFGKTMFFSKDARILSVAIACDSSTSGIGIMSFCSTLGCGCSTDKTASINGTHGSLWSVTNLGVFSSNQTCFH